MSVADLFGALIFGSIGLVSFLVGKKRSNAKLMIIGILLMGYPYVIPSTLALYLIGILLTASLFVFRG
jgi:hypothetical protein